MKNICIETLDSDQDNSAADGFKCNDTSKRFYQSEHSDIINGEFYIFLGI